MPRLLQRVTDHAVALLATERRDGRSSSATRASSRRTRRQHAPIEDDEPHARFSRSVADHVVETGEAVADRQARGDERLAEAVSEHQLMIKSIRVRPHPAAPRRLGRPIDRATSSRRACAPGCASSRSCRRCAPSPTRPRSPSRTRASSLENHRARRRPGLSSGADPGRRRPRARLARLLGKRTEQLAEVRRELKQTRAELRGHFGYAGLVGTSASMRRVYALIDRIKDTDVPLLVTGESGTEQKIVAHRRPRRASAASGPSSASTARPSRPICSSRSSSAACAARSRAPIATRRDCSRKASGGTILLDEDRRDPAEDAGPAARAPGEDRSPRGRHQGGGGRRARRGRDQPRPGADGGGRHVPGRPLLSPPRRRGCRVNGCAIAWRTSRRSSITFSPSSRRAAPARRKTCIARDALRKLCRLPVARQRAATKLEPRLPTRRVAVGDRAEISAEDVELPVPLPASSLRPPASGGDAQGRPRTAAPPAPQGRASSQAEFKAAERERVLSALTACNWNRVAAAKMLGLPRRTFYRRLKEFGIL